MPQPQNLPSQPQPKPSRIRKPAEQVPALERLPQILETLNIKQYDLLLFCDGSGSGWEQGCGWAAALIDHLTRGRRMFCGGANPASVNFAEIMPVVHVMGWYDALEGHNRLKQAGSLQVHIVTDSQYVATGGTQATDLDQPLPKAHRPHWAAIRELTRMGYVLHFHWMRRSETLLNQCADLLSSLARGAVLHPRVADVMAASVERIQLADPDTGQPIDLNHINPD